MPDFLCFLCFSFFLEESLSDVEEESEDFLCFLCFFFFLEESLSDVEEELEESLSLEEELSKLEYERPIFLKLFFDLILQFRIFPQVINCYLFFI